MDSDASDNFESLYEDGDDAKHEKLVDKVLKLNKTQNLKKASRTEPTLQVSEFNLVKSITGAKGAVQINELTKSLKKRKSRLNIGAKVKSVSKNVRTLPKPLDKPQADRIRRTVAYEKTRLQLDKWEPVVTSNRVSTNLNFPLDNDLKIDKKAESNFSGMWRVKTKLEEELEKVAPQTEEFHIGLEQEKFPLTMKEMLERRKETAKLRAFQSYKEAKARRQSKIKSKKYHRIQKREKIKKKLQEFEQLQKTNPEEALKKLEEIEKVRIEERFSLRHKGTGQWARSQQIRAKYDKESRQVLAQQLTLSRELTKKMNTVESESEEELETETNHVFHSEENNPWVSGLKPDQEIVDFVSGYRKYWTEKNDATKINNEHNADNQNGDIKVESENVEPEAGKTATSKEKKVTKKTVKADRVNKKTGNKEKETEIVGIEKQPADTATAKRRKVSTKKAGNNEIETEVVEIEKPANTTTPKMKKVSTRTKNVNKANRATEITAANSKKETVEQKKQVNNSLKAENRDIKQKTQKRKFEELNESQATSEWEVSAVQETSSYDIEELFSKLEQKKHKKMLKNAKQLQKTLKLRNTPKKKSDTKENSKKIDLTLPSQANRPIIDEELIETHKGPTETTEANINVIKSTLTVEEREEDPNIDPNKYANVKATHLATEIPDILTNEDNEEDGDQNQLISQAFEDDDLVEDFNKEKSEEINNDAPKAIDLSLPGWGAWGGTNIQVSKRKERRFIIKPPPEFKRRDDNKGSLIINEKAQEKIKEHLVSELPFPFKTVKDFEASIRAPISNTFVPETAYRKLIKPVVTTKMGTIIEPMSKEVLLNKSR